MDSQMPSANTASKGASHEPLYLSIGEKLVAIMKMLVFLAYLLCAITYDIVRYRRLSWKMLRVDFMKHVSILLRIFSLRELQALIWPTGINVSWYCMKEGLSHSIVLLVDDYDDNGDDDDNDNNNNEKRDSSDSHLQLFISSTATPRRQGARFSSTSTEAGFSSQCYRAISNSLVSLRKRGPRISCSWSIRWHLN